MADTGFPTPGTSRISPWISHVEVNLQTKHVFQIFWITIQSIRKIHESFTYSLQAVVDLFS
jgi:hypothetical protein